MNLQVWLTWTGVIAAAVLADGKCESDEFLCADESVCINATSFCDGFEDCQDGSDEPLRNVTSDFYDENSAFCRGRDGDICVVSKTFLPNVAGVCDENWQCKSEDFECADGSQCIDALWICDGDYDCRDESDEYPLRNVSKPKDPNFVFCRVNHGNICVVPKIHLPQMKGICEQDVQCKRNEFECADGSQCIPAHWFCNGDDNCRDGSDEPLRNVNSDFYDENSAFCRGWFGDICVVSKTFLPNVAGVCDEDWQCEVSEKFECADGSQCIKAFWFCDGYYNCRDGSGEILRSRTTYKANEIYYQGGRNPICAIPDTYSEFKEERCAINNNSCTCKHHEKVIEENSCFRCLSNPHFVLQVFQVCDGIVDCPDLSDECLCPSKGQLGICQSIAVGNDPRPNVHIACSSENRSTLIVDAIRICDERLDCPDGKDEKGCVKNDSSPISTKQQRSIDCLPYKEIRRCNETVGRCDDCLCIPSSEEFCSYLEGLSTKGKLSEFERCYDHQGRHGKQMCDGRKDCDNEIDEKYCDATRFYCTGASLPNIPFNKRCDLTDDCEDGTDEKNCPHFYCNDNGTVKYIPRSSVSDGVVDCESGIDECISVDSVFSDQKSMISNKIILAFIWIISLSAIVGCFTVIGSTVFDLARTQKSSTRRLSDHANLFKILIISLSISDFLVAVYTSTICVKALQFDKDYCQKDRIWRGSSTCSLLGVILVIGSEQSVFTMVLIAALRSYSVWRPFSRPNFRVVIFSVLVTWIISIILAMVPLIPSAEDYFVKDIQFNHNILLKVVSTYEVPYKIKWLNLMPEGSIVGATDWSKLKNLALTVNPSTTFIEFGYYSTHTVCLPTFFPDPSKEPAWGYTLFLILVNFLAFLAMLILYAILYRMASRRKVLQESANARKKVREANAKMQRKLTRIVASDFACWMPICITGFLQIMGVQIPRDLYLPAGLLIIPINSALNPLLYSDIPELVWQKLKDLKNKACSSPADEAPDIIEMPVRNR